VTAWAACWADEPCRLQSEASQPMCQRSWSGAPALKMSPHFHCVVERFGAVAGRSRQARGSRRGSQRSHIPQGPFRRRPGRPRPIGPIGGPGVMLGEHTTDQSDSESGLASARNSHNWPVVNDVMSAGGPQAHEHQQRARSRTGRTPVSGSMQLAQPGPVRRCRAWGSHPTLPREQQHAIDALEAGVDEFQCMLLRMS
jgi:hypothetical protein